MPLCRPCTAECEKLMELYERLEELDADKAEVRASRILHGLGFTAAMQQKKLKDFSGGWRMRVALARWRLKNLLSGHLASWCDTSSSTLVLIWTG